MKIFVSSRMVELSSERKIAVDSLHFAGHTPLYIETEPEVKDLAAKQIMDSLIESAEALVLIYYLSPGRPDGILGDLTPIQYEFTEFRKHHPNSPILLFRRKPDPEVQPSSYLLNWFLINKAKEAKLEILEFSSSHEFASSILHKVKDLKLETDKLTAPRRIIIRYTGTDFIGLIGAVSEILFSRYKLNVDYISHAGKGGLATLYISCSPRGEFPNLDYLRNDIFTRVKDDIVGAAKESRLVDGANSQTDPDITIDEDTTTPVKDQFYVELRTIDAPGQLNAVCKVLRELRFNIDELQLKPTPPEYERQTTMVLWISKKNFQDIKDLKIILFDLETSINTLIGVRAFSIRYVRSSAL